MRINTKLFLLRARAIASINFYDLDLIMSDAASRMFQNCLT